MDSRNNCWFACATLALCLPLAGGDREKPPVEKLPAVMWRQPTDIASRDLFYGEGGRRHEPGKGPFTFVKEDLDGNSPKFIVEDSRGVKWKVKVGEEARPETVASRLVWAVGYSTDEDYFEPAVRVENLPVKLHRGGQFVADGWVHDARWERMDQKKADDWHWRDNPFSKTRELNGLRVLMSLIGNYDMKDSQNAVYEDEGSRRYIVADLGATFGATGSRWPSESSKGDLSEYSRADFIKKVTPNYVDFAAPSWPMLFGFLPTPPLPYSILTAPMRLAGKPAAPNVWSQRWIGKRVPREDVRWISALLGRLSRQQIRDAFRAGHYTDAEIEGFSKVLESRIAQLSEL